MRLLLGNRPAWLVLLAWSVAACDSKSSSTPTAPTSVAPTRIIALSGNLNFSSVQVGSTADAMLRIANSGTATLAVSGMTGPSGYVASWTSGPIPAGGSQDVTVRFAPTEERSYNGTLTVNGDHTGGTNTISVSGTGARPPGPRTQFGAGTYLVGSDIAPGRYFNDPTTACYWERLSGLGGSLGEILANEFIGFNASQWIVDILSSDRAFKTDAECGTWFQTPRRGLEATISPGMWLVGSQVTPGTYRATAASGCYWERLRHFDGTLAGIIENEFVGAAGQQLVEVQSSDIGFHSDADCGVWTRVSSLTSTPEALRSRSWSEIERNWKLHRQSQGLH